MNHLLSSFMQLIHSDSIESSCCEHDLVQLRCPPRFKPIHSKQHLATAHFRCDDLDRSSDDQTVNNNCTVTSFQTEKDLPLGSTLWSPNSRTQRKHYTVL
jgi:hypothetical protein